ncbi:unnamed protein product [Cuscuta europaea]|uniref:Trichome birefringence-like N-terminal domain-containing protein n=1 Tax=Cuscuta europaea TaxID=41803 RepID=A0A9P0YH73_CUSEU|nr:unnamed protein product [Cuscuta europaea]
MESSRKFSNPISKASATHSLFISILIAAAIFLFNFSDSNHTASINTLLVSRLHSASTYFSSSVLTSDTRFLQDEELKGEDGIGSCDLFDGRWAEDESDPLYRPGSCPFIDDSFNCFKNGRPDSDYTRLRWKPRSCEIPRFDGLKMLKILSGKSVVFVGDSLNRNMWESLICSLRESMVDKNSMFEFKTEGYHSFKFKVLY